MFFLEFVSQSYSLNETVRLLKVEGLVWGGWGKGVFVVKGVLDGGFGEGHSQMVVFSKVVVVEVDKSLDCFFHRTQLDQRHLAVLPINRISIVKIRHWVILKFRTSWSNKIMSKIKKIYKSLNTFVLVSNGFEKHLQLFQQNSLNDYS